MATWPGSSSFLHRPVIYGKSTLAAQLDAADTVRKRMWHPIEPIDNDPVAFAARLLAGLERLAPFSPEMRAVADSRQRPGQTPRWFRCCCR